MNKINIIISPGSIVRVPNLGIRLDATDEIRQKIAYTLLEKNLIYANNEQEYFNFVNSIISYCSCAFFH